METINTDCTRPQLIRKATAAAKKWLKDKDYTSVQVYSIRGTFHVTNGLNYFLTAKYILETATGLEFLPLNNTMARLHPKYI